MNAKQFRDEWFKNHPPKIRNKPNEQEQIVLMEMYSKYVSALASHVNIRKTQDLLIAIKKWGAIKTEQAKL